MHVVYQLILDSIIMIIIITIIYAVLFMFNTFIRGGCVINNFFSQKKSSPDIPTVSRVPDNIMLCVYFIIFEYTSWTCKKKKLCLKKNHDWYYGLRRFSLPKTL